MTNVGEMIMKRRLRYRTFHSISANRRIVLNEWKMMIISSASSFVSHSGTKDDG